MLDAYAGVVAIFALVTCANAAGSSSHVSPGQTVSAVFPPPVTETFDASAVFPGPDVVGFPGPTPTGDEAEAIATAPVAALLDSYYPLINPSTLDHKKSNIIGYFGNLAPFESVPPGAFGLTASPQVPDGCELDAVHLWHRHGARYPTSGSAPANLAAKLHDAGKGFHATGNLGFLNTWTYKLGAEILTPFGRLQLFELGIVFRVKYGALLKQFTSALPVFRTESEDRMVQSALNFAAGFFGLPFEDNYHQVIVIESPGFNNTGAPYGTCVNSNLPIANFGNNQSVIWNNKYLAGALKRLQPRVHGLTLTIPDVFAMQQTCAYETVALGSSAFCDLFTEEEWKGFAYSNALSFHYSNTFGTPVASSMGIGYVQELVARLTHTPIETHNSSTNATIDNSNITMPLNQPIYVDATHDTIISSLLVALNMTSIAPKRPLPTDHIPEDEIFVTSRIVPFASNLVAQVLSCPASKEPSHIRFILNDGVLPLTGIKGCKKNSEGLCALDTFISAMRERIAEVDFAFDCLANYTISDPAGVLGGRPPASVRPKHI